MFVFVLENALENTFSTHFSHFLSFQTHIIIKIPIYKPKKKKKNENLNSTNPTLDRDRERDLREKERVEAITARSEKERSNNGELDKEREAMTIKLAARSKCLVEVDVVRSSPSGWVGGWA